MEGDLKTYMAALATQKAAKSRKKALFGRKKAPFVRAFWRLGFTSSVRVDGCVGGKKGEKRDVVIGGSFA